MSTSSPHRMVTQRSAGESVAEHPAIELVGVHKDFLSHGERVHAVRRTDLAIRSGEFFSLLGPSGCGKTTTMRMIAGFEEPTAGTIYLDGRDVTAVSPNKRDDNMVFQSYALFPHLDITENIAFGLKRRGVSDIARQVGEMLELVELEPQARKKPAQLSGGQQQRVALARALINRPEVLLLDEPLGALDLKLRQEMQLELKRIQEQVGITFLYVTHDQEEALTMSDHVAVLRDGRIEQVGTPVEVYERPASDFVAGFIGVSNLIEREGRHVTVRPEKIRILEDGEPPDAGAHVERGVIREVVYLGAVTRYAVDLEAAGELVVVRQTLDSAEEALRARGRRVRLAWRPEQTFPIEHRTEHGGDGRTDVGEEA
jgi:spermidine/putrescine transport system ATP-binding protein